MARYKGVLLDLGGVVFVGDEAIPGAVEAVGRLREAGVGVRFITNTTSRPLRALVEKLQRLGLDAAADEVFTPAVAARHVLGARAAHLLVHPSLGEDFAQADGAAGDCKPEAVVVGDAGEAFTYRAMNAAFRAIDGGAALLALAKNRTFKDGDGALSLDAGPFVAALEFAAGCEAQVIGKPAEAFFEAALDSLGIGAGEAVMIGDDVESDVAGAMAMGLAGILVRTGKYKQGDEGRAEPAPTRVADDLAEAVDWILAAD